MSREASALHADGFPAEIEAEIDAIIARYPRKESALVPILQLVQEARGFVSVADQERVALRLDLPPAWVAGVVSFYTMIQDRPIGRFHLQVCRTLSCALRGSERILEHLREVLDVAEGGTTADGRFTLTTVECLGSCGTAPVIQINDDYHEDLTVERIERILVDLKKD